MFSKLMPRDEKFFDLFNELAGRLTNSARLLNSLFAEPHKSTEHVKAIKDEEHAADLLTATISQRIDRTFITPFDREDIHTLAARLDDVIDLLDGAARRFEMLHLTDSREPAVRLAGILLRAADQIQGATAVMMRVTTVNKHVSVIKQLEEEGDAVYHEAVGALFLGTTDTLEVIKWKEMYDTLEHAIDSCMGVAQALQSIALKHG
jgi:predicted phosphate transport protein (TIGR00153 family)